MRFEAVILAGGAGTRLRPVIADIPKPMAPVHGKPFLEWMLRRLELQGVSRVALSVGYLHEAISAYFGNRFGSVELLYAVEEEPLGTGGGIRKGLAMLDQPDVFVLNGDTFFRVDLDVLYRFHRQERAGVTLALKTISPADRYGTVEVLGSRVTGFREKAPLALGLINGGVYCIRRTLLEEYGLPTKFSFEQDFLEKRVREGSVAGLEQDGDFIDIGVPADYERVQQEWNLLC